MLQQSRWVSSRCVSINSGACVSPQVRRTRRRSDSRNKALSRLSCHVVSDISRTMFNFSTFQLFNLFNFSIFQNFQFCHFFHFSIFFQFFIFTNKFQCFSIFSIFHFFHFSIFFSIFFHFFFGFFLFFFIFSFFQHFCNIFQHLFNILSRISCHVVGHQTLCARRVGLKDGHLLLVAWWTCALRHKCRVNGQPTASPRAWHHCECQLGPTGVPPLSRVT